MLDNRSEREREREWEIGWVREGVDGQEIERESER